MAYKHTNMGECWSWQGTVYRVVQSGVMTNIYNYNRHVTWQNSLSYQVTVCGGSKEAVMKHMYKYAALDRHWELWGGGRGGVLVRLSHTPSLKSRMACTRCLPKATCSWEHVCCYAALMLIGSCYKYDHSTDAVSEVLITAPLGKPLWCGGELLK